MFLGQYHTAMEAVREFEEMVPEAIIRMESPPMADMLEGYFGLKFHALIRFGRWQEILAEPLPHEPDLYLVTTAISHYAKTVAEAALGHVDAAEREAERFEIALSKVPSSRTLFNNICLDILAVASEMLRGEIEYREKPTRDGLHAPAKRGRAGGQSPVRRAVGLDAAGAPRAGSFAAGAGTGGGGRAGLSG